MLIDTHCHLEMILQYPLISSLSSENYQTVSNIIQSAYDQGITKIINIGTTYQRCLQGLDLAQKFKPVYATVGIHPCDITTSWRDELKKLEVFLTSKELHKIVGIGETGLDFYHPGYHVETQKTVFQHHIEIALKYNLALVVHTRSSFDETFAILQEYKQNNLRCVIHCFSEDLNIAQEIQNLNFMMGIGGIITYPKNEYLRTMLKELGLRNVVFETDAPFLPPQHIRGKQNTPAQIRTIAEYTAELLNLEFSDVARITTENAEKLFLL